MSQKFYKEDLLQYKISGQTKPFIDQKLQMQIPSLDVNKDLPSFSNKIFSHYVSADHTLSYYLLPIDQKDLEKKMDNARASFEAWKKLKERIQTQLAP